MRLFHEGWEFSKQHLHTSLEEINQKQNTFRPVGIPHDWLIENTENLYEDATGWYRCRFDWKTEPDQVVMLRFEGIYMDSVVYVNDRKACEWKYGYSSFDVNLTPYLIDGANEIKVSVTHQAPNSRWYTGAGIYRNVRLMTMHRTHLVPDGIYIHTEEQENGSWLLELSAEASSESSDSDLFVRWEMRGADSAEWKTLGTSRNCRTNEEETLLFEYSTEVNGVKTWDITHPDRYQIRASLISEQEVLQSEEVSFGFRTIEFLPEKGFLLNHRKVKLNGACEHHDLGCLGAAYHSQAMRRKFRILKEMGVNAVRTAHNMPDPDLLDLADEMGILIIDESFDMWESSKTEFDYARFFPEWYERDTASWIRRDRNHPCIIMWGIGNEIYDTHTSDRGQYWTRKLMEQTEKHDPKKNAYPTIGSNYMPWENAQKCADIVKLAGYNYGEKYYDRHHEEHPDWIIYGSETCSTVQSRGVYRFPYSKSVLSDMDEQCSSLGNAQTSWGAKSSEACIIHERDREYSCGQFLWSGFDYIGEPTPYHTRSSYLGQIDTAGFPKDSYYIFKAEWTDYRTAPMVHVFPYWDYNEGQLIDIRVCSNAPKIELFVNGVSQGIKEIDHAHGTVLTGNWQVPFHKGSIRAAAMDETGKVIAEETRESFGESAQICVKSDRDTLSGNGNDLAFLEISMADPDGRPVENADNRVTITVEGPADLIGTDNGDSTDTDGYKDSSRRLFGGKLLAVIKSKAASGEAVITLKSPGLPDKILRIPVLESEKEPGSSENAFLPIIYKEVSAEKQNEIPVRAVRLRAERTVLDPEHPESVVHASICPGNADDHEVIWMMTDDGGIPVSFAELTDNGSEVLLKAKSDGTFRLRCMSKSGTEKIRIISELEITVEGFGKAFHDPYSFISAGLYDYSRGEVGNGNELGVATARDGETQVGFHEIDFGPYGSDEITLPIFALTDDPYRLRIYEGMPDEEGSELVADVIYQKPSIWNTYQEETYRLNKKLKGVTSICLVLEKKVHIKGFEFTRQTRAWDCLTASSCDGVYGDSFRRDGEWIRGIGNNVTIEYGGMDFGADGTAKVSVAGSTELDKNTIILAFLVDGEEKRQIVEFQKGEGVQTFDLEEVSGNAKVSMIFLPGSNFDFHWIRFHGPAEKKE